MHFLSVFLDVTKSGMSKGAFLDLYFFGSSLDNSGITLPSFITVA